MQTLLITIRRYDELEALTDAELAAYKADLIALARLTSTWEAEHEEWMRQCPQRLAERAAANARAEAESAARIAAEIAAIDRLWEDEQARIDMQTMHAFAQIA